MTEGVVINCWRNAPDNLRPYWNGVDPVSTPEKPVPLDKQTWLHPQTRDGLVFGSGNFLIVRHDDGSRMHYAHGRQGSIPERLCPHNGLFLSPKTFDRDSTVPERARVRVKRGEFLFRTGSSGTSGAPHLHVELIRPRPDDSSRPLLFRYGFYQPLDPVTMKAATAAWTSFAKDLLPLGAKGGPVLIWPSAEPPRSR
jgi:hypothetical protein